jgi:2-keto-3-deoxy-L-fuconate dehydrogenase
MDRRRDDVSGKPKKGTGGAKSMMGRPLDGLHAVVTAAGQGIGRATAIAFAEAGATVTATDRDGEKLRGLPPGIATAALDVTDTAAVAAFVATVATPQILFNCAGVVHGGTVLDARDEDLDFGFDLNVKGAWRTIRAFLPGMLAAGGGTIVNVASVASSVIAVPNRCVYGTTKAALIGLTKSVAADFVTRGVRCNAICPGTVETPSLHDRMRATGDMEAARATFIARQPMGRLGTAEEIAAMAVYLASPAASYVTGQAFVIDGGWANV